jgi:hypothetical protein
MAVPLEARIQSAVNAFAEATARLAPEQVRRAPAGL